MNKVVRLVRELPLRSRLSLLTAAAVAFAVAAVSVTCWFIVRDQLYSQLGEQLRSEQVSPPLLQAMLRNCQSNDPQPIPQAPNSPIVTILYSDGSTCLNPGSKTVPVQASDLAVAKGTEPSAMHSATTTSGMAVRVFTQQVVDRDTRQVQNGIAVSIAKPLDDVTKPLSSLAWILLIVSGIGVVGAGAAGLWVARAGLRPVDKLTETVEHVARTEDLTVRIPVEGNDEIARLSESFNSMTASLASSRELQQQLIADAGHELRTPLTSLRTNIELLTRSEETGRPIPPADRKALLASVTAQMTELAALIGDLQTLSRSDEAHAGDRVEVVALQDTVEAALRRARLRGPELTITADLEPWFVRAEPSALERAIVNILDNAVKFSPPGGTVDVRLHAGELSVRDHGPGIPTDELPHVFDRFWRSPDARALPGSGLGLSIVARTVQQAGGEVSLRPAEDGGTIATVRLPGAPAAPPELP
ncbi:MULTISPECIES: sensor histidine kinase [unclassified Streptomyces]|uniref:sensor histidine kinase n=1 Tax=unclassified Streptomyces TaxID=2593676 RepID=UPI002DD7A5CC|nr:MULTISPECIES: HAMP domain-containing sensor histidine kinase [unclassified Streptomyces]WSD78899.1 HAMP domain-containing histidine kinase [Streptomyces sp. NBC_01558]WSK62492.1 HAMP domain-containing histidine kinase [Streptomyces sp. NBC_01281]